MSTTSLKPAALAVATCSLEDELREPTNARARLRRVRQQEAATLYAGSYDRRIVGNMSAVRPNPHTALHVDANVHRDAYVGTANVEEYPRRPVSVNSALSHPATPTKSLRLTASVGGVLTAYDPDGSVVLEGRAVNVTGQSLDGKDTAISRLMHGDFYCGPKGGGTVHELSQKKEGKFMRFRADSASRPPNCDVRHSTHDAGTMTKQPKQTSLIYQKKQREALKEAKDLQQWPDAYLSPYGVAYRPNSSKESGTTTTTRSHFNGKRVGENIHYDEDDDVATMAPLDLDRVFNDRIQSGRVGARSASARPSSNRSASSSRPGTAASYRGPTYSSMKKTDAKMEERMLRAHDAAQEEAEFQLRHQPSRRPPPQPSPYETALQQQHSLDAGKASILSTDELKRIMALVEQPTSYAATPRSGGGYRPQSNGQFLV
jgi:hypothetical protein